MAAMKITDTTPNLPRLNPLKKHVQEANLQKMSQMT